jgi:phosphoribosyl 1,2-cyclic phosphodiesterase
MRAADGGIAVCPLGSGSKGNAYWVETAKTAILIDVGFSYKQLAGRIHDIGRDIDDVSHIFLTHEHNDHIKALRVLLKRHSPTVWTSGGTLKAIRILLPENVSVKRLNGNLESAGDIAVQAIPVQHDAAEPFAYRFDAANGSVAVVTDLGEWSPEVAAALDGPDLLVCEANHDPEMLEMGPYPYYLKQRIASNKGHLNNRQGAELAAETVKRGTREVILGHLSATNNDESLALDVFGQQLNGTREKVRLHAASQALPGPWVRSTETVVEVKRGPSIASLLRRPR